LAQSLHGERGELAETLHGMSATLQGEIDARAASGFSLPAARMFDAPAFAALCSQQLQRLALLFAGVGEDFERASSPAGTPEKMRRAYAGFLDGLLAARRAFDAVAPPPKFHHTDAAFRGFVASFYEQIAAWPEQIEAAAAGVTGETYELTLRASYDLTALQSAFAEEIRYNE
jgi:hypothetical protein